VPGARRAGVGQGTLFEELAAAVESDPDAFFVLLRSLFDGVVGLYGLAVLDRNEAEADSHLKRNRERISELLERPLRDAKAAGALRPDLTIADVS
jgi:hypothetical protein